MTTIAYIYGEEFTERRNAILARATECGARLFSFQTGYIGMTPRDAFSVARPDACIVEADYVNAHRLTPADFPVPVVVCDLSPHHARLGFTGIRHDRESAARTAIGALLDLDLPSYAFAGYHRAYEWSQMRERVFREMMQETGKSAFTFPTPKRHSLTAYVCALEKWIAQLPTPCGIFAVNDEIGEYVLTSAERLGINVPESLAVVGIDNDIFRCENTIPPLASVPPDFARSGRLAVDLALAMIQRPGSRPHPVEYEAGELVRRSSLKTFRTHDDAAARALDYIRAHATDPRLDTPAVARIMDLPVRTAQLRFSRHTGHTIFDEIEERRFHTICALLRDHKEKIGELHLKCGYGCSRALRNAFFKRTGKTPSDWRKDHT